MNQKMFMINNLLNIFLILDRREGLKKLRTYPRTEGDLVATKWLGV